MPIDAFKPIAGSVTRRWDALDGLARRILKNVGLVVSGDAGASALGLLSLALTARTLGPELLGILVMIEAYTVLVDRWIRPETWQVLIKYGTDALAAGDHDALRRLIKLSILIDLIGAMVAAAAAFAGLQVAAGWFGWDETTTSLAALYCTVLIVQMTSTSTAVLRLFDRFGAFAYSKIAAASLRLALVMLAWWLEGGLTTFVLIAMTVTALHPILMVHAARNELKRQGYDGILRIPMHGVTRQYPRLWRFLLSANLSLLLRKTVETSDLLIVGALLGPAASGGLHIAKRLSMVVSKLGRPVQQVIYPDVSKLWAKGEVERFRKAVGWTNLIGGAVGLAVFAVIAIDPTLILWLFAGDAFTDLTMLLLLQMLSVVIFMFGLALRPALYSMERDVALLRAVALATAAFYAAFFGFMPWAGAMAASLGHCAFNLVWLGLCLYAFRRRLTATTPPFEKE